MSQRIHPNPKTRGFTLIELLVVIGIIVLVAALAIPAFSYITASHSQDAAQNQVSAILARAREDAIALQQPRGVVFYYDTDTGRSGAAEVYYDPTTPTQPTYLELVPDREQILMPVGVGCQVVLNTGSTSSDNAYSLLGVVLFDSGGEITVGNWSVNPSNTLGKMLVTAPPAPLVKPAQSGTGSVGFVLYDQEGYRTRLTTGATEAAQYMRDTGFPFLINRYNGTLIRGE